VIAIQLAAVDAVHAHSRETSTCAVPLPPAAPNDAVDVETSGWQSAAVLGRVTLETLELPQDQKEKSGTIAAAVTSNRRTIHVAIAQRWPNRGRESSEQSGACCRQSGNES
jgi:hypothetical protein